MLLCPISPLTYRYSAKQLSSTDWVGFDLIWEKRMGIIALKDALNNHLKFEDVSPFIFGLAWPSNENSPVAKK